MRKLIVLLPVLIGLASCGIFHGSGKDKTKLAGERLAVLNYEAKTEADPDLAGLRVTLPAPVANAEWTQPGGNAAKALGNVALGANLTPAWSVSIGEGSNHTRRLVAAPVVAGGRVFVMDTLATIRALDARDGSTVWQAALTKSGESDAVAFGGGVSWEAGHLYATSGYGLVAAYDAASGKELWRADLKVPLRGAPTVAGDRLFVMTQDNQLKVLSTADGKSLWEAIGTVEPAGLLGVAAPAVALGTAVVGFSSGELTALRVENGRTVWQDLLARTGTTTALASLTDIDAPAVVDGGRVFAIGHGGRMVALDIATGQRVWERNLTGTSMPWVAGDFIFAVTVDAELVCVTRDDGKVRWVTQLPRYKDAKDRKHPIEWDGPVLASDRLLLVNSEGQLVAVSPLDGTVQSTTRVGKPIYLPPVIAGGTLYTLSEDGRLSAFR